MGSRQRCSCRWGHKYATGRGRPERTRGQDPRCWTVILIREGRARRTLQISVGGGKVAVLTVRLGHDPHSDPHNGVQASMVAAVALGRSEDSSVSQHRRVDESHPCDALKP